MPQQPDFINKVNAVIKYFQNPCDAPWAIYFETALPALGEAILTILDFGFDDVVRGAVRPKGLRSGRHTRRGRRGGGLGKAIPEIGEMLGAMVPGSKAARDRKVSQGVKNLWLLDGVIQRVLWYWLVADVTATFAFNWTSAIQESRFCQNQGVGAALATVPPGGVCFAVGNFWTSVQTSQVEYATGGATSRNGGHQNGGKPFNCSSALSGTLLPPFTSGALELRSVVGGIPSEPISATEDADGLQSVVDSMSSGGEPVLYQMRSNGGGFACSGSSFTMGL
jgi:hypothetical protein